jgi:phage N-6-adenine-methyltransferase
MTRSQEIAADNCRTAEGTQSQCTQIQSRAAAPFAALVTGDATMNDLVRPRQQRRDLEIFDPAQHRMTMAVLDFGIEEVRRIRDWPALEEAVDLKMQHLLKFLAWWDMKVTIAHGARRGNKNNRDPGSFSRSQAERLTGMTQQRVSDLRKALARPDKFRAHLLGAAYAAAMLEAGNTFRTEGTKNEWFSPPEDVERGRAVLGTIDLDPASSPRAQETVKARKFYDKEQNGLRQPWEGRVWLNPPYSQPLITEFVGKLCDEWQAGRVTAAIMLTHNYTDTAWFQRAAASANAICFTQGRVRFYEPDGALAKPMQGQAFFYFGNNIDRFTAVFQSCGFVVLPSRPSSVGAIVVST